MHDILRRGKHCMHVIYIKKCFTFVRIFFHSLEIHKLRRPVFLRFDVNVSTFPLIQNGYFFKIAKSDLLEITSYIIWNARIASWYYVYSNFRRK